MSFSTQESDEVLSEMNVTPLVDVMLVLLVVFIVTAPLLTNAIPLNLPRTDAVAPPDQREPIVVSIDAAGDYYLDHDQLQLEVLQQHISELHQEDGDRGVQLRADEGVEYGHVARAMAAIQRAGVTRVAVITSE